MNNNFEYNFKLSVIVPVYNEESTILTLLDKIIDLKDLDKEIIVVDDGSTDKTSELISKYNKKNNIRLISHNKNKGKGAAIKTAKQYVTGNIIIIQDADLEYDPSDYIKLIKPIEKGNADVVYGSRFAGSDEKRVLFYWHSLGNLFLTTLSNMFTNINLSDMECCYKAFKADLIKNINLKENRFGFEPEITAKLAKRNLKIYEVGVKYYGRKYSEGKKITWKDGFSAIRCIIYYNLFSN